jgi:hypothetical protein
MTCLIRKTQKFLIIRTNYLFLLSVIVLFMFETLSTLSQGTMKVPSFYTIF